MTMHIPTLVVKFLAGAMIGATVVCVTAFVLAVYHITKVMHKGLNLW